MLLKELLVTSAVSFYHFFYIYSHDKHSSILQIDYILLSDFMWGAVKDPLDTPITFDSDGLDLAFKYFSSTTLTMRLAGITQINTQISLFNDICASEPVPEAESVGQQLAQWLCSNQIMQHLFGPNLHVEVSYLTYQLL